jgi:hypothetical protein
VNRRGAAQEQRDGGEQVMTQPHGVDVQRRARSRVAVVEASPQQKAQRACVTNAGQSAVVFFLSWLTTSQPRRA